MEFKKEDEEYLGPFETQLIYVDCFLPNGRYAGVGHGKIWFTPEFGVMVTQEDEPGESNAKEEDKSQATDR